MPNANTQPVYPKDIIRLKAVLRDQVIPRNIVTQTPVELGTAGENGAIIHSIDVRHLGNNAATVVRLWVKQVGSTGYLLENELTLPEVNTANDSSAIAPVNFTLPPILPNGNTGLHLEPGETLYCGLGTAVASGVVVTVRGGDY